MNEHQSSEAQNVEAIGSNLPSFIH